MYSLITGSNARSTFAPAGNWSIMFPYPKAMHLSEPTPPPPSQNAELEAWPALCQVLQHALNKKPEERFQSARAFAAALKAALAAGTAVSESAFPDWPIGGEMALNCGLASHTCCAKFQ